MVVDWLSETVFITITSLISVTASFFVLFLCSCRSFSKVLVDALVFGSLRIVIFVVAFILGIIIEVDALGRALLWPVSSFANVVERSLHLAMVTAALVQFAFLEDIRAA